MFLILNHIPDPFAGHPQRRRGRPGQGGPAREAQRRRGGRPSRDTQRRRSRRQGAQVRVGDWDVVQFARVFFLKFRGFICIAFGRSGILEFGSVFVECRSIGFREFRSIIRCSFGGRFVSSFRSVLLFSRSRRRREINVNLCFTKAAASTAAFVELKSFLGVLETSSTSNCQKRLRGVESRCFGSSLLAFHSLSTVTKNTAWTSFPFYEVPLSKNQYDTSCQPKIKIIL